jgi:hypothetical protein
MSVTKISKAGLKDNSIDSDQYVDGSIDNAHLADDAVNSDEIASGAVDNDHMAANSVDSDQYVDGSIDNAHLAANSVDSDQYVDGSIDEAHLASASVTSAKLSGNLVTPGTLDVNGQEFILDADADTSITADTDDTIDIKIAGADDFQFTANTFNILSGSTLDVNSGATIANSGTATGFGKLLQIVSAQSTTTTTIALGAGGSYAWGTTGLTCAITPTATTNKIHAIFCGDIGGVAEAVGSGNTACAIGLAGLDSGSGFATGTAISTAAFTLIHPHMYAYIYDLGDETGAWRWNCTLNGLTVAGTTSEITYEVYIAPVYGTSAQSAWGAAGGSTHKGPGSLILMEIEA